MAAAEATERESREPGRFELVANGDLPIGDEIVPAGTVLARLELPPGAKYGVRFVTRCVEDLKILAREPE